MSNSLKIGDNDMKKMMILAMMMVMTISACSAMPLGSSKNAMSYNAAKNEALVLSDKMARSHGDRHAVSIKRMRLGNKMRAA